MSHLFKPEPYLQRIFRIMILLMSGSYTLKQLECRLDVSERTVRRYVDSLESAGFTINRLKGTLTIDKQSQIIKDLNN